ncbi:MAG TPA: HesB/YadR/YfhF family protein [Pseudogracilibacillus sp.]|nr:HesB/YadR/YfhF family protein [Pseudogracilibacillus sp.]
MIIQITEEAANWFKEEYDIAEEASLRFFVRYGGGMAGRLPGFSLGVAFEQPVRVHTETTVAGLTFFIEEADAWYFEDENLIITLDEKTNEPQFTYEA